MPTYPISVPVPKRLPKRYHPAAGRECAKKIEDYINKRAKDSPVTILDYSEIGGATGIDKELVTLCLFPLTASYYGITINNPDLKGETRL